MKDISNELNIGLDSLVFFDDDPVNRELIKMSIPEIKVIGLEYRDTMGPFGAKGVGEIGTIPTAAAIANAYYRYDQKRRYSLPLSPPAAKK